MAGSEKAMEQLLKCEKRVMRYG